MRGLVRAAHAAARRAAEERVGSAKAEVTEVNVIMFPPVKFQISAAAYRRITFWTIVALGAIVLSGAAVRLTGSGLGCPDWPTCADQRIVPPWEYHAVIEFGNRLVTGLVSIAVVLAVLGSWRRRPRRPDLAWWSLGLVAGVAAQVVLGRWVVTSDLAPVAVIIHFLLSMVLLWNAVVLHHRAGPGYADDEPREAIPSGGGRGVRAMLWATSVAAGWVLVNGTLVTGSGPHGGDEHARRLGFDISNVARIHSLSVIAFCLMTLAVLWMLARAGASRETRRPVYVLLGVIAGQGFIGYVQYFTDVPEILVGLHVLGAVSVWWAVLHAHLTVSRSFGGRGGPGGG